MSDSVTNDLRNVPRLIIRGDGSFNADPKGDWVSARDYDKALGEIERLREALEMVQDADDDCMRDGLTTIPHAARAKIDAALAPLTALEQTP